MNSKVQEPWVEENRTPQPEQAGTHSRRSDNTRYLNQHVDRVFHLCNQKDEESGPSLHALQFIDVVA